MHLAVLLVTRFDFVRFVENDSVPLGAMKE